jgi:predicted kinase
MLLILRGIPGCGKSTFARQWLKEGERRARVNRDDIRMQMFQKNVGVDGRLISKVEDFQIETLLSQGYSVIVDNVHVARKRIQEIASIANRMGIHFAVKFFDVDLKTALERNELRDGHARVPEKVIRDMAKAIASSGPFVYREKESQIVDPYIRPVGKRKAILCDLDGSLAHMNGKRGPFEWLRVDVDDVDEAVLACINAMYASGVEVIFLSGRDSASREKTISWLAKHGWENVMLYMRAAGDMRKDNIVKYELFNEHIRSNFDVLFIIDDRAQVVRLWKQLGLKTFNVSGLDNGEF